MERAEKIMKKLLFVILIVLNIASQNLYSQETQTPSTKGRAAIAGQEASTKWYIGTATGAILLVGFGLITFLANTDPTTFSHHH
jgi:hypothetical protein